MDDKLKEIRADSVTIEVTDAVTGRTFRRTLPIDYLETANALRLAAENAHGAGILLRHWRKQAARPDGRRT